MQSAFLKEISILIEKRHEYRNPFVEISDERIVLDSRICVAENCVKMMRNIEKRGILQNEKDIQSLIKQMKIFYFLAPYNQEEADNFKKVRIVEKRCDFV